MTYSHLGHLRLHLMSCRLLDSAQGWWKLANPLIESERRLLAFQHYEWHLIEQKSVVVALSLQNYYLFRGWRHVQRQKAGLEQAPHCLCLARTASPQRERLSSIYGKTLREQSYNANVTDGQLCWDCHCAFPK